MNSVLSYITILDSSYCPGFVAISKSRHTSPHLLDTFADKIKGVPPLLGSFGDKLIRSKGFGRGFEITGGKIKGIYRIR